MATNLYINSKGYVGERELIQDIIEEFIQIGGFDIFYIPRIYSDYDKILGEDNAVRFSTAIPLEAYLEDHSAPRGQSEVLSKFGFEIRDSYTLSISPRRFKEEIASKGIENITAIPREGDLIFLDLREDELNTFILLEIKFFENENPHYQLGRESFWKLDCEMYRYSNEIFETGIPLLDTYYTGVGIDQVLARITISDGRFLTTSSGAFIVMGENNWHNKNTNTGLEDNDNLQVESKTIVPEFSITDPFNGF